MVLFQEQNNNEEFWFSAAVVWWVYPEVSIKKITLTFQVYVILDAKKTIEGLIKVKTDIVKEATGLRCDYSPWLAFSWEVLFSGHIYYVGTSGLWHCKAGLEDILWACQVYYVAPTLSTFYICIYINEVCAETVQPLLI